MDPVKVLEVEMSPELLSTVAFVVISLISGCIDVYRSS
jgi:hypothetical protein